MKLLIDDANIDEIRRLYDLYPIDGVTTNPSILAKSGRQPYDVLIEIREFIGEEADLRIPSGVISSGTPNICFHGVSQSIHSGCCCN